PFRDALFVARYDVDADIAGAPHQIVHDRTAHQLEPPRARRLADNDLRYVVGVREMDDIISNAAAGAGNGERLSPERFSKPHGVDQAVALLIGQLQAAPRLDADRGPLRMQPVREPLGVAHK